MQQPINNSESEHLSKESAEIEALLAEQSMPMNRAQRRQNERALKRARTALRMASE